VSPFKNHSRWGTWEDLVLARVKNPDDCQLAIQERQSQVDDDEAEKDLVRDEIIRSIKMTTGNPDEASVFISSQRMAELVYAATGEKMTVGRASNYIKTLAITELKKRDQNTQRGWLWTGMKCTLQSASLTLR
jgi:hypothetical protein